MKTKKLLLIGVIALVVIGCVLAAGCTSTETATTDASTDAIVGVWFSEYNDVKSTKIILADGTGYAFISIADDTVGVYQLTWNKNADGTYAIQWSDGKEYTWTPTSAKDTMTSSAGKTQVKKSLDEAAKNILGVWYNNDKDTSYVFNADGTGIFKHNNGAAPFTWKLKDNGKFELTYTDGTWADGTDANGKVTEWTYDGDTNAIFSSYGTKYIHPSESVKDKITLTTFSTEPIVGQWTTKYQKDGKTVDAVMTLRNDGTGYWMALGDVEGIQLTAINKDTWKKTGENTYQVTGSSGRVYEEVYDPTADTLTEDGTTVYTRLDPIVGIWYGQTASGDGSKTSTIIKPDGTGVWTFSYDNGTSEVSRLTWKKNSDGTYAVAYSTGYTATYTVDSAGTRIVSSSGSIKEKAFLDSTFLMSVTGAWYNQDKDASYVFNADGTGFGFANGGMMPFTWKLKELGEFELTYADEAGSVDSGIAGKTFVWTYDRDNNVFISSAGTKYIRPAESVIDKITLYS